MTKAALQAKSMNASKTVSIIACILLATACSSDKPEKKPETPSAPTTPPPPNFSFQEARSLLFQVDDLGKNWTQEGLPTAYKKNRLLSCSDSEISLPGKPQIESRKFGAPKFRTTGANYARMIIIYPDALQASAAMEKIAESVSDCPSKKKIPFEKLPDDKFVYQHDDTWEDSVGKISDWNHIRGFEKSVYPASISTINVIYVSIDYAQRGNVILSSIYGQRAKPKDSPEPIKAKATEILTEQLAEFG